MLNSNWFLHLDGQSIGPLEEKTIVLLIKNNRVLGTDYVWTEGLTQWVRAMEVSPLSQFFSVKPMISTPTSSKLRIAPKKENDAQVTAETAATNQRKTRVKIEAYVVFDSKKYAVINLSETGLLFEAAEISSIPGKEISFKLTSPLFSESFDLTGILVREDYEKSKNLVAIEFTRLNPRYRKQIQSLVQKAAA